jgi:hypothetical protein
VRLARSVNATVRAVGGFSLFLLAFELRRQGVGTGGLGLLLAGVGVGAVAGAFLLPRAAGLVREAGLLGAGLAACGFTALLLAGRIGVASAALAGLVMGGGVAAARLGFESLVQREVPPAGRGTAITRAETAFQLAWVGGAVLPVALPLPPGPSLVVVGVVCLAGVAAYLLARRLSPRAPPLDRRQDVRSSISARAVWVSSHRTWNRVVCASWMRCTEEDGITNRWSMVSTSAILPPS